MRFMTFAKASGAGLALVSGNEAVDVATLGPGLPATMEDLIAGGRPVYEAVRQAAARNPARKPLSAFTPALPIARPGKIVCLGLNYAEHAKEGGHEPPTYPALFMRAATSLIPAGAPMIRPRASERLDYEAELMIVVGKRGRHIPEARALEHIFGYTLFNDGSVRDYQRKTTQWTAGKNFDATGPVGPWIVTADALPPGAKGLRIQSRLNGAVMQDSNTDLMIFPVAQTIAILSEVMTLEPGDLIATGTPSGVGHARKPPVWMKAGDTIEIEVEGIGILSNPVADEPAA